MSIKDYLHFLMMMIPTWLLLGAAALTLTFPGTVSFQQPVVAAETTAAATESDASGQRHEVIENIEMEVFLAPVVE